MLTMVKVIKMCGQIKDISFDVDDIGMEKPYISIIVEDFDGFDEDYSEIDREVDWEQIHQLMQILKDNCLHYECEEYGADTYEFEDCEVGISYASWDI